MVIARWILFLPAGFVAAFIAGPLFKLWPEIAGWPAWLMWFIDGLASGIAFALAGAVVAPKRTPAVKWVLLSLIIILGSLSALASLTVIKEKAHVFLGIAMILTGLGLSNFPIEKWGKESADDSPNPD